MQSSRLLRIACWLIILNGCGAVDTSGTSSMVTPAGFIETGPLQVVATVPPHIFPKAGITVVIDLDHQHYEDDIPLRVGDEIHIIHKSTQPTAAYLIR
ncbi:MAG TPA: hypothetical protein VGE07_26365, partial [Herpetosiphonaceae bacterium]